MYRALQLLGEVLAQLAIVGMNNRCLRERERWKGGDGGTVCSDFTM